MKKVKENWIGEQCSETEENLRKNNSKRAYQLVKDLTTVKQRKATTVQDRSGKCLTEERYWTDGQNTALSCTVTRLMEIHQYWTVPRQTQRMTTPSFARSGGCSTITEEREVSLSRQHPSRTGPSRWRGCNHCSRDILQQDLADRRMANPMDPVLSHHTSQELRPAAVQELPNNKPHQSPKQSHAEDHTEQIPAVGSCGRRN